MFGRARGQIEHRATVFVGRLDVEKTKFISACGVIGLGLFDRIARVDQIDEIDTFDGAPFGDVQTGNDAGL